VNGTFCAGPLAVAISFAHMSGNQYERQRASAWLKLYELRERGHSGKGN